MDPMWRFGVFFVRTLASDQNYVGLHDGSVTRARALVRTVPCIRWDFGRVQALTATPFQERPTKLDSIEAEETPTSTLIQNSLKTLWTLSEPNGGSRSSCATCTSMGSRKVVQSAICIEPVAKRLPTRNIILNPVVDASTRRGATLMGPSTRKCRTKSAPNSVVSKPSVRRDLSPMMLSTSLWIFPQDSEQVLDLPEPTEAAEMEIPNCRC